ncbi:MAG TPA: PAS domain S-box protein [Flavisolibacter sp.]|jgi:PAS domain S-box-containing protein|nr:PAS domain S-box protein [Flavisolibacter sp.]
MMPDHYHLFDHLREGVQLIDNDQRFVYLNDAAAQQAKIRPSDVTGKKITDVFPGLERTSLYARIRACLSSGSMERLTDHIPLQDGSSVWFDLRLQPVKEGVLIFSADITAEKELEALQIQADLERRLLESQTETSDYKHALDESCIVAITDQKGTITHVNANFCRISGYSKAELLGQDHQIINSGYHPASFIRELWVTIAHGKIWRGELRNKAKDGSYYWVDTTIVPFLNEKGKPYQYLAIRNDITARKQAEEELVKSNEQLETKVQERTLELTQALEREKELSDMKSRFVSMASHEFRTPLSAILSSTSLVEHYLQPEQTEKRTKHLDRIRSSVKNLTNILDEFLSLEKLEQGKVETHATTFDLKESIQDAIEDMEGMSKRRRQTILFQYEGEELISQDKKILKNVLLNLLSNAIKYSPDEKAIKINVQVDPASVRISIRDEGIGIPKEAQQHLFEKFYRANNAVNIQGTGLGLNIVKRYMELLKGSIHFESEEGQGTVFHLLMPRYRDS